MMMFSYNPHPHINRSAMKNKIKSIFLKKKYCGLEGIGLAIAFYNKWILHKSKIV